MAATDVFGMVARVASPVVVARRELHEQLCSRATPAALTRLRTTLRGLQEAGRGVYRLEWPRRGRVVPFFVPHPHAGEKILDDYPLVAGLRRAVLKDLPDYRIDRLWEFVPFLGGVRLIPELSRTCLDFNRGENDISDRVVEGGPHVPGEGREWVIRPVTFFGDHRLLARPLTQAEFRRLIDGYWCPYHRARDIITEAMRDTFGWVYRLEGHSCPSVGNNESKDPGQMRPPFTFGNAYGKSAPANLATFFAGFMKAHGYPNVGLNFPYSGAATTVKGSDPERGIFVTILEISRAIYMDENRVWLKPGAAARFQNLLAPLSAGMLVYLETCR